MCWCVWGGGGGVGGSCVCREGMGLRDELGVCVWLGVCVVGCV